MPQVLILLSGAIAMVAGMIAMVTKHKDGKQLQDEYDTESKEHRP